MATKAQLEAELKTLKAEMAHRRKSVKDDELDETPESEKPSDSTVPGDAAELEDLWAQLQGELADLSKKQPVLTLVGALALGFILGRGSK
ncbi:hypothetical protein [Pseudophaeobacter sp.]|uniref:hypothetical protein n=1 Tax=Pseudophaeobacter sp. TaxID=1971739 RepID=UPI00329A3329